MAGEFAGGAKGIQHAQLFLLVGLDLLVVQQLQVQVVGVAEVHGAVERVGHTHSLGEAGMRGMTVCRVLRFVTARATYDCQHSYYTDYIYVSS